MKLTDGLFHKVFDEIAAEYPDIENEHWIVDIGAAKLADTPEAFDVLVMPNLYGDILSDVAAQIAGSVGLAGSANIGEHVAMFEAIHGSAPRRAGQNLANPSGLLLGAVMMLVHIDQTDVAERVHNAWLRTIEDGIHTYDIYKEGVSKEKVGTKEFAEAVVAAHRPKAANLESRQYKAVMRPSKPNGSSASATPEKKELVGVDVFLDWTKGTAERSRRSLCKTSTATGRSSTMISNRGVKVWPGGHAETFCSDHWRCRYLVCGGQHDHARADHSASASASPTPVSISSRPKISTTSTAKRVIRCDQESIRDQKGRRVKYRFKRRQVYVNQVLKGRIAKITSVNQPSRNASSPLVAVIMGSKSDWETMRHADEMLDGFGVAHECRVMSAHRTPRWLRNLLERGGARRRGDHRRRRAARRICRAWSRRTLCCPCSACR